MTYVDKYVNISEEDFLKNKDLILDLLFYRRQLEIQREMEGNKGIHFKSDARLFGIKEPIVKPLYEYGNCRPKTGIEYPQNKKFAVVLTHDVDRVYPSWKYRCLISAKLLSSLRMKKSLHIFAKKENPYETFRKIIALEERYEAKSSFYFLTSDRDIGKVRYRIDDLTEEIRYIRDKNWEVGLHGGYYSYGSAEEIKKEKERLERVLGTRVIGYRNHYLRFNIPNTRRILEDLRSCQII